MAKLNSVDLLKVKMSQINIFPLHLHFLRKILIHMYGLQQFEVLLFLHQKTPISAFYTLLEHPDPVNILMLALHHHKHILIYYHSWHKVFTLIIIRADAPTLKNEYTSQSRRFHLLKIIPHICHFLYLFSPAFSTTGIRYSVPFFNIP